MTTISSDHKNEIQSFRNHLPCPWILKLIRRNKLFKPPEYLCVVFSVFTFLDVCIKHLEIRICQNSMFSNICKIGLYCAVHQTFIHIRKLIPFKMYIVLVLHEITPPPPTPHTWWQQYNYKRRGEISQVKIFIPTL